MGTEVAISFTALRAQLETERSSLYKIDENIKKIVQTTGRFSNDRFNNSAADYLKGGPRLGGRNSFPDFRQNDDSFGKRKQETKTVFSRLSARTADSDGEDGPTGGKRSRVESAVSRELPTRAAVLRAQGGDEQARTRNRRIFGSLLGTLQKFKQEEIVLQTKEDKKAQVERKIEEQARVQKEKEQKERKTLFAEREHKKATIKALEAKMARVQEFEKWEASQLHLAGFILTRAKPHVYWIPKKMTDKATEKLNSSRKYHEKCMVKKRAELQEELQRIEQRCLRPRGPQRAKENAPRDREDHEPEHSGEDGARKRDKFTADVDEKEKEDSDGDEHHEEAPRDVTPEHEPGEYKDHEPEHSGEDGARKRDKFTADVDEKEKEDSDGDEHHEEAPRDVTPEHEPGEYKDHEPEHSGEDGARKRDKFTADVDEKEKEDSDGDEHHEEAPRDVTPEHEPVTDESKIDTSLEQNTTTEVETEAPGDETAPVALEVRLDQASVEGNPPEPEQHS